MDSKWKWPALKVAKWAFKHGECFDLYGVSYLLGIPASDAAKLAIYLKSLRCVEKQTKTRYCKGDLHTPCGIAKKGELAGITETGFDLYLEW